MISVKDDGVPAKSAFYLVYVSRQLEVPTYDIAWFGVDEGWIPRMKFRGYGEVQVTHWAELPERPYETEEVNNGL